MNKTKIEWTDATCNPVTGRTPISEGCANCYAARMAKRLYGRPMTSFALGNHRRRDRARREADGLEKTSTEKAGY